MTLPTYAVKKIASKRWAITKDGSIAVDYIDELTDANNFLAFLKAEVTAAVPPPPPPPESPAFSVAEASATEGGPILVAITRSGPTNLAASVMFETYGKEASPGTDFANEAGVLTFQPGETEKKITVGGVQDTEFEGNETLIIKLSDPVGAVIEKGEAVLTIIEDDPEPPPPPPPLPEGHVLASKILMAPLFNPSGGMWDTWKLNFDKYHNQHVAAAGGLSWETNYMNYYDRARILMGWSIMTGDPKYHQQGLDLALIYRKGYLEPNNDNTSSYWSQMRGVALHYLYTGDEMSRRSMGRVADLFSGWWYLGNLGKFESHDGRIVSRTIENLLLAHLIKAPSVGTVGGLPGNQDYAKNLKLALDKTFAVQNPDGGWRFAAESGKLKPFMVSMICWSLAEVFELFEQDPRIIPSVQRAADCMWNTCWNEAGQAMHYIEPPGSATEGSGVAPDLNGMISIVYGWLYKMTRDPLQKERALKLITCAIAKAWLSGGKQFNETYNSFPLPTLLKD